MRTASLSRSWWLWPAIPAIALACGPPPAPVQAADAVVVGTVGSASANLWPVFIGINKGFFAGRDLKIDLVYVPSSAAVIQQLTAGSLDVTMSTGLVDPIRAIEKGAPDRHRADRGAVAALCPGGQVSNQDIARSQGQDRLGRRREGHHPPLCGAHAGAERLKAERVRHGVRRRHLGAGRGAASPARSMPRSCCRRRISRPLPTAFMNSGSRPISRPSCRSPAPSSTWPGRTATRRCCGGFSTPMARRWRGLRTIATAPRRYA